MKGEKVVTNLLPYGAERPRCGMVKKSDGNPGTNQIEVFWEPPRGDFTKYELQVMKIPNIKQSVTDLPTHPSSFVRMTSIQSKSSVVPYNISTAHFSSNPSIIDEVIGPTIYNINSKLQTYTIPGLQPGEKYEIQLKTKTGELATRQYISDIILTKPLPPRNVKVPVPNISTHSCKLIWQRPESHSCLIGYQILVKLQNELKNEVSLLKSSTSYQIKGLLPGKVYEISISSLCVAKTDYGRGDDSTKTESIPANVEVITLLEKVKDLELETATPDSLTVKWNPQTVSPYLHYKISIESIKDDEVWRTLFKDKEEVDTFENDENINKDEKDETPNPQELRDKLHNFIRVEKEISGQACSHKFVDLPELVGSGFPYQVQIQSTAKIPTKENKEVETTSEPVAQIFLTRPYPPSSLRIKNHMIKWNPSKTPHITDYILNCEQTNPDGIIEKDESKWPQRNLIGTNKTTPSFELSKVLDKSFRSPNIFKFTVASIVEMKTLDRQIRKTRSLDITEKFKMKEDGEFEQYIDEQNSMVP
jgi:hypothetical protein